MTINQWLNSSTNIPVPEQDILQDLTDDNIQAGGNDLLYIIRDRINEDYLFGETPISEFKDGIPIEMMLENIMNFNGDGDLLSKFGVDHSDSCTLVISSRRSAQELRTHGFTKPRSGDLIYMPISDSLWEIKYVKNDKEFYQFGKNYSYRLECSLFQYSHEEFEVPGAPDINSQFSVDLGDGMDNTPEEDDIMKQTLGISPKKVSENSDDLVKEASTYVAFDPNNPFGN